MEDGGGEWSSPMAMAHRRANLVMTPSRRKTASEDVVDIGPRMRGMAFA
jgi:hypothetical protein